MGDWTALYSPHHSDTELDLRVSIRERLVSRRLPLVDGRASIARAHNDEPCICCGDSMGPDDRAFEHDEHPTLRAHRKCFTIWLAESVAMRPVVAEQRNAKWAT